MTNDYDNDNDNDNTFDTVNQQSGKKLVFIYSISLRPQSK